MGANAGARSGLPTSGWLPLAPQAAAWRQTTQALDSTFPELARLPTLHTDAQQARRLTAS